MMPETKKKPTDVDKLLKYINASEKAKEPFELDEREREKFAMMSFAHNQRKKGYPRKEVVDQLMTEYDLKYLNQAYTIIRESELVMGAVSSSSKDYARVLAEDWILKGIRMSLAGKDLRHFQLFVSRYMKLHGLEDLEAMSIPADALEKRHQVHLTMNPEDVGMKRLSKEDILQFIEEMKKTPRKRVIDVTPKTDD
jgi:hypothetical protein